MDSCQCIGFLSKAQSRLAGGQGCASRQESGPLGSAPPPPSGARRAVRLKRLGRIYRYLQAEAEPAGFRNLPVPPHSSLAARFRFLSRDERRKLAPEGASRALDRVSRGLCTRGSPHSHPFGNNLCPLGLWGQLGHCRSGTWLAWDSVRVSP